MIMRLWRGWTALRDADAFEQRVRSHAPKLDEAAGYRSVMLLRRDHGDEAEFVTLTCFDTMSDIVAFAGEDYTTAVIPEPLRAIITRVEPEVKHYQIKVRHVGARGEAETSP